MNTGISAIKARKQIPFSLMKPGKAIESRNADANNARTSEQTVLRLLLDSILTKSDSPKILGLFVWTFCNVPNIVLKLFARAEDSYTMSVYSYNIASLRITSFLSALSNADFESSKSSELNYAIIFQTILNLLK